ncbi:hypothetical protein GCM10007175_15610 [Pseudarthrobacter scleromae]|uniref:Uncharacterized protein n=1 Tax=Pseudarthrobacter scleromae TaxID=158897 RepID=A0ABQ2CDS0_9MICC|nr:hypothetical protein GCM10007175_15610 [Pseudarthrobacter scleromae]
MAPNLLLLSRSAIWKLPPAGTGGHFRQGPGTWGVIVTGTPKARPACFPQGNTRDGPSERGCVTCPGRVVPQAVPRQDRLDAGGNLSGVP